MKKLLACLLLIPCFAHALVVNCYERRHSDEGMNLSYVLTKTTFKTIYQKYSFGQVLESGKISITKHCLGRRGNYGWFSVCVGDEVQTQETNFGKLITLKGNEQGQSGFELFCDEKVMSLLDQLAFFFN